MSISLSKNKEKRSRSSSSEPNNSFVKNVTSRVSGLLPATITKWFSSPSSSNANGSAQNVDATDSSTEDEAPDTPITTQPPPKRMRFTSPGEFNHYGQTDNNCFTANIDTMEMCHNLTTVQSPPGRTTFRRETNFVSTPLRSPNEESTSDRTEKDSTLFKSQHSVSAVGSSVATKRKSLFDSPSSNEASKIACMKTSCNTMRDPREPCFKPSLLGSPFYPGRTMYGGASASYINSPNIKQRKNTLVNESSSADNTISQSTRRIMDLLEHYSSPLSEAKRIAHYVRAPKNDSTNSNFDSSSPSNSKVISYKTQELHVPSIASILRLKKRSRLMDTTTAARQIIASHSSTCDYVPYTPINMNREETEKETSNKLTTKVKSRLTRPKRGDDITLETELPTPVSLPTAVLQIDKDQLPKFSFGIPSVSSTTTTPAFKPSFTASGSSPSAEFNSTKITESRKPATISSNDLYKFSSPEKISSDTPQPSTTPPKFTFGSPERSIDKMNGESKKRDTSCVVGTSKEPENKSETAKSKDWKCPDCWVCNKEHIEECVCCGGKKPSQNKDKSTKCSVCKLADSQPNADKCVNCEKVKLNNISKPIEVKATDTKKWKCDDCWVSNDDSAQKCVCCGSNKPTSTTEVKEKTVPNDTGSEWKCDDCWIKNKSDVNKCVACGASKPGSQLTPATAKPKDDPFKVFLKQQPSGWNCSSCLVKNDDNKTKCICCESEKPGSYAEPEKKLFNFGTNTTFKFGIDPKAQEATNPKPVEIISTTDSKAKIEESETNNNILAKPPVFSFSLPAAKPEDKVDGAKKVAEKIENTPKMTFSFGVPPSTTTVPASVPGSAPIFGSSNKLAETTPVPATVEKEKQIAQEVPRVDFTVKLSKSQINPTPINNIFATPLPSQANQDKPPITTSTSTSGALEKTDSTIDNLKLPGPSGMSTPATSSEATSQPTFSFSGAGIKLFAPPLQTAPVTSMLSIFNKSEPSTNSTISIFQKPDVASSSVSLFQKNDSTTTTATPPSLGATAPLFNFGSNSTSTIPQAEKPKFSFTFGSASTTEESPMFKPPTTDNTNTNKFTLPTNSNGNGLSGKGLPTTTIPGNSGLSVNSLGVGNNMSNNPLTAGSSLQTSNVLSPPGGIFSAPAQKENMWATTNNNSSNMFVSNASTNSLQKPATFTFGSPTPFNASSSAGFGSNTQPAQNVFGISNQNASNPPSLFASPVQSQPQPSIFGAPQQATSPAPALGLFATPSVGATPTFGTPNASIPSFEAPSLNPAPAPTFNFNAQQSTGVFGFGQQQQPQQQQQQQPQQAGGVYNFGTAPASQVQFSMGSAPNMVARRVRKAVRRNNPR